MVNSPVCARGSANGVQPRLDLRVTSKYISSKDLCISLIAEFAKIWMGLSAAHTLPQVIFPYSEGVLLLGRLDSNLRVFYPPAFSGLGLLARCGEANRGSDTSSCIF